jgi:hypothetical protein
VGVGEDEYIVASDSSAIVEHTTTGDLSERQRDGGAAAGAASFRTMTIDDIEISPVISQLGEYDRSV